MSRRQRSRYKRMWRSSKRLRSTAFLEFVRCRRASSQRTVPSDDKLRNEPNWRPVGTTGCRPQNHVVAQSKEFFSGIGVAGSGLRPTGAPEAHETNPSLLVVDADVPNPTPDDFGIK